MGDLKKIKIKKRFVTLQNSLNLKAVHSKNYINLKNA